MPPGARDPSAAHHVWAAGGSLLLAIIALAPWPFGTVTPGWQVVLALAVLALLGLWAAHAVLTRRVSYTPDAPSTCVLGLVILTACQLVPLPASVVGLVSPAAAEWHRTLYPADTELLPGESRGDAKPPTSWVPLSMSPANTRDLLAGLVVLFLVYAAARNFVAVPDPKDALRRLAWVGFATGVALALIALLQNFSGDRSRVFWAIPVGSRSCGPFVNKNHFAFQMNLFLGLAGGLFVSVTHRDRGWRSPAGLGLLGGAGLMATALAFSESRGGMIAAVVAAAWVGAVAWLRGRGDGERDPGTRAGLVLGLGVAAITAALVAWLGLAAVVDRLATLGGENADNRSADWRAVWPLVERFPLAGVGGGALIWAEPTVRTRSDVLYAFNTLDNEYLEALVEGGVGRLLLTLGLALAAIGTTLGGYARTRDPLLLGCTFGLTAVACQSAGDFGLHTPSVALTAAVVTAFATARSRKPADRAANPAGPGRPRTRRRRGLRDWVPRRGEWVFTGGSVFGVASLMVVAGLAVTLTQWRLFRATTFRDAASQLLAVGGPVARGDAVRLLDAATRTRPDDPVAHELLVQAHLTSAINGQLHATAGVVGGVAFADPAEFVPEGDPGGHVSAALRAARKARECQPLSPVAHVALGTYSRLFTNSEPPAAHFARAKKVAAFDPDVWYASGRSAAAANDWSAAAADWRESLARSRKRLQPIVALAGSRLTPDEIRTRILPDEPDVWLAAVPYLFAPPDDAGRERWYGAIAARCSAGPEPTTLAGYFAWATALEHLGDRDELLRVWRAAADRFPESVPARSGLAAALEDDERYDEAVPVLEWLIGQKPDSAEFRLRLEAARHALKLQAEINAP
ncbi:membrane protein : Putative membrane protein OS=Rhodopirellula sallentina SM41 GN=RSSM_04202 PE=4 SV=1: O-antigen_lig [Gemmataceae bacterium]|nr:membrane protein : Putative membrane protein OS=Rhodopirellula sallentina SM41 GN=RSSM_04202 PE=4 SV=1: O-antigen_lig [Gemmataceae bacterium]VTT99461.1 membrane protein : Putative membrane protein OS=Rhodopirellula sallentina SM41 GN=RSSM_04202 PE=4 SV=1: O-antigen_lig [Gemmataceae bacterium]